MNRAPVPADRPADLPARIVPSAGDLIGEAELSGTVGFLLADARTGAVLEARDSESRFPPASTVKALTALYAIDSLGRGFRYRTRLVATGPVREGRIQGDLILRGGGDPTLSTDDLAGLAGDLAKAGVIGVTGRLLYDDAALPGVPQIDASQPAHVAYNPAIGGLNLNFNRVHFQWRRDGGDWALRMDAPAGAYRPEVGVARMQVVERSGPVYTYASKGGRDEWTVASTALGNGGSRWLPVRRPGLYSGEVFRALAGDAGIALPAPEEERVPAGGGAVLADHASAPLEEILRGALKYSTNLTAEVAGLSASAARTRAPLRSVKGSGARMARWARSRLDVDGLSLVDHSGLGAASRVSPAGMVRALIRVGPGGALRPLLPEVALRDERGRPRDVPGGEVRAKTGTLNYVKGLAGYITAPGGRELAFAIYMSDLEAREALARPSRENPPGGRAWLGRAVRLQRALLDRWVRLYGEGAAVTAR